MGFSINTNITSLQAQEYLRTTSDFQSKTITRVTSGLRIISSGDDAAGLAIANSFRSDRAVLTQGVRNANDGLSTLQTIDGGINNISQLLDRARTLAAQSASGTFTGDRNILNSEFQSVLGEIDRQAQAIGLDQGGAFAKSLAVFIGGGRSNAGISEIENGSVSVDLSQSTVDAKSLGLKGVQAVGATGTDIGTGSATTSVQDIVGDATNIADQRTAGYTEFKFVGPGFGDSEGITVSVNTAGVTDTNTLVTAINSAIDTAGNGSTAAATAFKDAGIKASVTTDSDGKKQLAFSSSESAFQVKANDLMANALMGNFGAGAVGASLDTTVQAGANTTAAATTFDANAGDVVFRFQGAGMTSPVDITLSITAGVTTVQQAVDSLTSQVASNSTLQAAGITLDTPTLDGAHALQFTSARGEKFDVAVTGDVGNELGFGTFVAGDAGEVDYATRTGTAYDNTDATDADGSVTLEFSINGAASNGNAIALDLTAGDAAAATVTGTAPVVGTIDTSSGNNTLDLTVDGVTQTLTVTAGATTDIATIIQDLNGDIATQFGSQVATVGVDETGALTITSATKGAGSDLTVAIDGTSTLMANLNVTDLTDTGEARTGADIANALNQAFAADTEMAAAGLEASFGGGQLTIASNNNTYFRANSRSTTTGDIGFGANASAASFTGNTVSNAPATSAQFNSGGADASTAFTFAALGYGSDDQTITISANDASGVARSETIVIKNDSSTTRNGRNIDQVLDQINSELQQTNNSTLQKVVAVKVNDGGTEKIQFLSTLEEFQVSVGQTASANGIGSQGATDTSAALDGGSTASIDSQAGAQAAVSAVASAVAALGESQAVVGKGQNTFNFAVSLAQTQLNNLAASESRIRDADLAAEAANMTKAQILQQAGIAALAQANSAPQAVLSLLRG